MCSSRLHLSEKHFTQSAVCFLTQTFQSGHRPWAALTLTVAKQEVEVRWNSADRKKYKSSADSTEQKPESRRLERRQTFVTEEQMISSDSRGRDREAGRKVTKVDLLLCPHCLSEETLNLCTVSSAVRDTILNDSHRKSNESSCVLLCNSWWRKLDSPKQTRQSFTWFSPHQYFRKSFISTLWKAVESEMDSLSPLVVVGGRTVITPVAEFCLEDLTEWI